MTPASPMLSDQVIEIPDLPAVVLWNPEMAAKQSEFIYLTDLPIAVRTINSRGRFHLVRHPVVEKLGYRADDHLGSVVLVPIATSGGKEGVFAVPGNDVITPFKLVGKWLQFVQTDKGVQIVLVREGALPRPKPSFDTATVIGLALQGRVITSTDHPALRRFKRRR